MNWITSSYCDANTCVQWAWVTSSYSVGGNCVQWAWVTSSHCDTSACVEVAQDADTALIRDSKDPQGPMLHFPRQAVREFLTGAKAGEFDQ